MKKHIGIAILLAFLIQSCSAPAPAATPTMEPAAASPQAVTETAAAPAPEPAAPTPTVETPPQGKTITVTSTADSGPGSLRQAMQEAQPGDTVAFDPTVFPPHQPAKITLASGLPPLKRGWLTLDASGAGVRLDGSQAGGEWTPGFEIQSDHNTIMGFEIADFSGPGVLLAPETDHNRIGGDRKTGGGPLGQGNLIRGTSDGIGLQDSSDNVISGNLVGTGLTGKETWGNRAPGIFLEGASKNNVIGPGNVIAYSGTSGMSGGVEIRSAKAAGNRITQNNILNNSGGSIAYNIENLPDGFIPRAPVLLEFDRAAGTASGAACPGCTVELFSRGQMGDVFEGSATADAAGHFSIAKGSPLSEGGLTATSFGESSNTSPYSAPQNEPSRRLVFQTGAKAPPELLPEVAYDEMPFNKIGTMVYLDCQDDPSAASFARMAREWGYKWMRVNVEWYDWPEVLQTGEFSDFEIKPCQDKAVDLLNQNGVELLHTITYWDPQIKVFPGYTRFRTQEEIDRYLDYTRFLVGHFKGRVTWYSILNEPNLSDGQRAVKVEDYIILVRQVIPVIREIDPQAKIAIGEVCPLNQEGSLDYLKTIIASDVLPLADGLVWHGSSENSPDYNPDYYLSYPGWVDEIVKTAHGNGFKGEFFASELQWRTPDSAQPIDGMPWFYSNTVAAKYYDRGLIFNLSRGFRVTAGHERYETIPQVVTVINSLTRLMAGAEPQEIEVTFSPASADLRSAGFVLPDGRRMVALWRDVKAVDEDPGVETTVTLPGVQANKVSGVDPLFAYRQELVFEQSADLTVPGVMVYDYPTFLVIEK